MGRLFRQFSFPGGIPSHVAPETPGSIHEGGELGYALVHAYGAAFDNPDLIVACVVGDGEAETGPLAASWHSNKFLNPATRRRGAADPAPERLQDRQSDGAGPHTRRGARVAAARLRVPRRTRRGRRPASWCTSSSRRPGRGRSPRSAPSSAGPARTATDPAALADDRAAHPQGLDRAEGGGRPAGRGHLARAPGPARGGARRTPSTWPSSRSGCAATTRRSCSTPPGRWSPNWPRWRRAATGG